MLHQTGNPSGRLFVQWRQAADVRHWLAAACLALCLPGVRAQFHDTFDDGTIAPWSGDTAHFVITPDNALHLAAPSGQTTSLLGVPIDFADSMTWMLSLRLDFAPSASNQLRIWLGMTNEDPGSASGYVLEIGATGDQDALVLQAVEAGSVTVLGSSPPGLVADDPVVLTLRVTLRQGTWTIDALQHGAPQTWLMASGIPIPLTLLNRFALQCRYTETRRDKFSFDDVEIGPWMPDIKPPGLVGLRVVDERTLAIVLDEAIDTAMASNPMHYALQPDGAHPEIAEPRGDSVLLQWLVPFISERPYLLHVAGLADLAGNVMLPDSLPFTWTRIDTAVPGDLLITEIMADPTPAIGLPETEYLEIHHAGKGILRLSDYMLNIGASARPLPDSLLRPGEFVIVCASDKAAMLKPYGRTMPVANMPALPNAGARIRLTDKQDHAVLDLTYADTWYDDPNKDEGGWSLEMRNPMARCAGQENWSASGHLAGGTPGRANAQWEPDEDIEGPVLLSVFVEDQQHIVLTFDEALDNGLMADADRYMCTPHLAVASADVNDERSIVMRLVDSIQSGVLYTLSAYPAFDCMGNPASAISSTHTFGLPATPGPGDLLINEILFDPVAGGSRFLEVLNTTDKFIDLRQLAMGRIRGADVLLYPFGRQAMLAPGGLAVFTPDTADLRRRYVVPHPSSLFLATLPSWDESADNVTLAAGGAILDSLTYSRTWHHPSLRDPEGVSLERIAPNEPSDASSTWHSAAATAGHATPTGSNSQADPVIPDTTRPYSIDPAVFSPDGDGEADYLTIRLRPDRAGDVASVLIHDLEGRESGVLLDNRLAGRELTVRWDGRRADGTMAERGIYVIFIRLWRPDGLVTTYLETCALVQR
jgi:hypothetical protein